MQTKRSFSTSSLFILLVSHALVLGAAYALTLALAGPGLMGAIAGATALVALVAWLAVRSLGTRAIDAAGSATAVPEAEEPAALPEDAPPRAERPEQPPDAAAVQMLAILQREGRLIDFLQEDIQAFDDAQVGAAVRGVHEGCRSALREHVTLAPVMDQDEGSRVRVEQDFDARAIRLAGHAEGDPPFNGTLRHRGWRVERLDLPELMQRQDRVVAPAEVEV